MPERVAKTSFGRPFKRGDMIQQRNDAGEWTDAGRFERYDSDGSPLVLADCGGFYVEATLMDPQNARVKP